MAPQWGHVNTGVKMDGSGALGQVAVLRRYPVKSMQGEQLEAATIGALGVVGDRALAVVDEGSGQVVRAKTPDLGPMLLACRAAFTTTPHADRPLPPVEIELPDGTLICSDADPDRPLSRYFGRAVQLVSSAPPESAFVGGRSDFLAQVGLPSTIGDGSLLDAMPLSVLTTSTLDQLGAARPATLFDERRFRMNVIVTTDATGFLENDWPGHCLRLGEAVQVRVAIPTPRCVLTTMAQDGLPRDPAVLRTAVRENSLEIKGRSYPCVGAYVTVESAGEVRTGDLVHLVPCEEPV